MSFLWKNHVLLIFIPCHSRTTTVLLRSLIWLVLHEPEHFLIRRLPLQGACWKGSRGMLLTAPEILARECTCIPYETEWLSLSLGKLLCSWWLAVSECQSSNFFQRRKEKECSIGNVKLLSECPWNKWGKLEGSYTWKQADFWIGFLTISCFSCIELEEYQQLQYE